MQITRWPLATLAVAIVSVSVAACSKSDSKANDGSAGKGDQEVIYGDDNRTDFFAEKDASLKVLSESTVALMSAAQIGPESHGLRPLTGSNYGQTLGLCSDERFVEQNSGAFCSGFLIADDLIVTAGHCIPDDKSCAQASFVFGYHIAVPGVLPSVVPATEVYSCAELVHTQSPNDGADFAIVRLDRKVSGHAPLMPRASGDVTIGEGVTVMGYPEGLPLKIAGGAAVRSNALPGFFVTNSDTYGGNSGSAVVNSASHDVEGVLVRGDKDFVWDPAGCARSYRCKPDACRGEDVTRISEVMNVINSK